MYNKRGCGYGCGQMLLYFFSGDNTDVYVLIYILYLITWILRNIIICPVQCTMLVLCHWPDPLPNASQTLHQKKGLVYIFAWKHFITQCPRINCTESHQLLINITIRLHVLQTHSRIVSMLTYAATGSQKHSFMQPVKMMLSMSAIMKCSRYIDQTLFQQAASVNN